MRYLIVANETLLGDHVADAVQRRIDGGDAAFHLVVPAAHRRWGRENWTEGQARAAAQERLDEGMERLQALGAEVTGEVGDPSPVLAVHDALIAGMYDEVIVSTLPLGVSRWLRQDVVHRIRRAHPEAVVTHLVASPALV